MSQSISHAPVDDSTANEIVAITLYPGTLLLALATASWVSYYLVAQMPSDRADVLALYVAVVTYPARTHWWIAMLVVGLALVALGLSIQGPSRPRKANGSNLHSPIAAGGVKEGMIRTGSDEDELPQPISEVAEEGGAGQAPISTVRQITLSDDAWAALGDLAIDEKVSRSELVRRAVAVYLASR